MQKRVQVFLDLLETGEIEKVSVDADQADSLLRLLDAVVIKLEGGTEEDLQILNVKPLKPFITKDISKEKEDNKSKSCTEKKAENRYYNCVYNMKNVMLIFSLLYLSYFFLLDSSDENKVDNSQRDEKGSKNDQKTDAEVKSAEKDGNAISDSEKTKENDECKDAEDPAGEDKPRMYI